MADDKKQFDQELGFAISPKFSKELRGLFAPTQGVPAEIDQTIAEMADKQLAQRQRKLWLVRLAVPATAAAAVIVVASIWLVVNKSSSPASKTSFSQVVGPQVAKDSSLAMARRFVETNQSHKNLTSAGSVEPQASTAQADIDRNGRVDILDAFKLARNIEAGLHSERMWDINGDGLVNREDVDKVAFAAVRLDRGIL